MRRRSQGFTLVELLVVITIIGMLMGLLLPAVQSARESGRRATCMNNEKNVSLALINYESVNKSFPGYANTLAITASNAYVNTSWVPMILPQIDRRDLYDLWKENTKTPVTLRLFICPSNPPETAGPTDTPLAYVVNTGKNITTTTPSTSNLYPFQPVAIASRRGFDGLCHDQVKDPGNPSKPIVRVGIENIKDGASNTLLLGEFKQTNSTFAADGWKSLTENVVGFQWKGSNATPATLTTNAKVNESLTSNHGNGSIVAFCDGRVYFLREDIDYGVFAQLMTPAGSSAFTPNKPLSDADF